VPPATTVVDTNVPNNERITFTISTALGASTGAPELDAASARAAGLLMLFVLLGVRRRS
jgi:hypothetical protein